jgi:hypothetical protein
MNGGFLSGVVGDLALAFILCDCLLVQTVWVHHVVGNQIRNVLSLVVGVHNLFRDYTGGHARYLFSLIDFSLRLIIVNY